MTKVGLLFIKDDSAPFNYAALEQKTKDILQKPGYEHARFLKVHKARYQEEIVDMYTWLISTYLKLNNAKFDSLDNTKKLNTAVSQQLVVNNSNSQISSSKCLLI